MKADRRKKMHQHLLIRENFREVDVTPDSREKGCVIELGKWSFQILRYGHWGIQAVDVE